MPTVIAIDASRANRPVRTGVEWYAYHVIQGLKKLIPADQRVVLYSEEPLRDGLEALPPNWESRVLRWPPRFLWTQLRLSWELLRRTPDLLYLPAHLPPLLNPAETVITLHDAAFMVMPEAYSLKGRAYLTLMYHVAVRTCRSILTVSQFSKDELIRLFHAKPEQVTVAHLGFDAGRYRPVPPAEAAPRLAKYGLNGRYFLCVGRMETKKNLAGTLEAFRRYRAARPGDGAKLVFVGKPGHGYERDIVALTDDLKPHVVQLGYVAAEDMPALYSSALALVFVSLFEGFGIPMLEAFACGTPVLGANGTSFPEVAGDAALLVDPRDTAAIAAGMARLADDAALRNDLRQKGSARLAMFSWERTARTTWSVLSEARK